MRHEIPVDDAGLAILRGLPGADPPATSGNPAEAVPATAGAVSDAGSLITRCLADIAAEPVRWLWPGRIARGKITIIAGNPGLGKSQATASIAAVVTTGGQWPVDRTNCESGDVLFLSAEDDPADTLRPRLEAAGANLRRIHFVDGVTVGYTGNGDKQSRTFSLAEDIQALTSKLQQLGAVAAVVIDPITAYLDGTDSHKNADVRGLLAPLAELAARHNTAIIGVSHLTKAAGSQPLMRVTGSLAFVAAARAAYLVTADQQDKTRRLFLPLKNNLGPDATGLAFRIEGATVESAAGMLATSRVSWESAPVTITADEAMQSENQPKGDSALSQAIEWLHQTLVDGPVAATALEDLAQKAGISRATVRRAADALHVMKAKAGMKGPWEWYLPPKMLKPAEDAQQKYVSIFGEFEHLRETAEEEI